MLKETDFKWLVHRANNIPDNPIDCHYCIVDHGDGTGKMYMVKPMYAQDANGVIKRGAEYKYFVFFDCSVRLATAEEKEPFSFCTTYSGYVIKSKSLIAIFDTMDDAKKRAYKQYAHLFGYVMPHIIDDIEGETKKHFVVEA